MLSLLASASTGAAAGQLNEWFVVAMGVGTVFAGLIAIIIICVITGALTGAAKKNKKTRPAVAPEYGEDPRVRQEIIAAVCAACAEDMGTNPEKLRVVSFKKIN